MMWSFADALLCEQGLKTRRIASMAKKGMIEQVDSGGSLRGISDETSTEKALENR